MLFKWCLQAGHTRDHLLEEGVDALAFNCGHDARRGDGCSAIRRHRETVDDRLADVLDQQSACFFVVVEAAHSEGILLVMRAGLGVWTRPDRRQNVVESFLEAALDLGVDFVGTVRNEPENLT